MEISSPTGHSAKPELRAALAGSRLALTPEAVAEADARRFSRLTARLARLGPATVACYVSAEREPGTLELLEEVLEAGTGVLLPVITPGSREPDWAWWSGEPLVPGPLGILAPPGARAGAAALGAADVIILPGLAGTAGGARLGRGGGWYDRALVHARPGVPRWLLLYDTEVMGSLPVDDHDQPVTDLVTERRWVATRPG